MSKYFYQGVDISTIISTSHPFNGTGKTILENTYTQFPQISNMTINNNNFDKGLTKNTGYSVSGVDIANQIPSNVVFYQSQLNTNYLECPVELRLTGSTFPEGNWKFNSPKTYPITIPNIYNSIGVVLCGGGGGGGGNGRNNVNNSQAGAAGGGGGFTYARNIDLNTYGRSWTLNVGGGGSGGAHYNNNARLGDAGGGGGRVVHGSAGGDTILTSSNNVNDLMRANGGAGGIGNNNYNPYSNPGSDSGNLPNRVTYPTPASPSVNYGQDGTGFYATCGGRCVYTAQPTNYNSGIISLLNLNSNNYGSSRSPYSGNNPGATNNYPGVPAGGDLNNRGGSTNISGDVVRQYRNQTPNTIVTSLTNFYGGGGGGAGGNNTNRHGNPGGPGAPGFAIIYYYL